MIGGVLGASLGNAALGWSIGTLFGSLFVPGPRQEVGKLQDLRLSGSTYGAFIPMVYGQARVGGNIIWMQQPLEEQRSTRRVGGASGIGGTRVSEYEYFATFLVLLCEAPVTAVRRIWADDLLIYDADEIPATEYSIDMLYGEDTQNPWPPYLAAVGAGNAPAYKGWVTVGFDRLPVTQFGNRIPNLSFEIACALPVSIPTGSLEFRFNANGTTRLLIEQGQVNPPEYYVGGDPLANNGELISWEEEDTGHVLSRMLQVGPQYLFKYLNDKSVVFFAHNAIGDGNPQNWTNFVVPAHIFAVLAIGNWVTGTVIYRGMFRAKCLLGPPGTVRITSDDITYLDLTGVPTSGFFILECLHNGVNSWMSVDGKPKVVGDSGPLPSTTTEGFNISEPSNTGTFYLADIAAWSGGQSDTNRRDIIDYLQSYWELN